MKFIWFTTELSNKNFWGGSLVSENQAEALQFLGHDVRLADPVSDISLIIPNFKPDIVYLPVEFVQYPFFQNILHYKKINPFFLVIGIGQFDDSVKKLKYGDFYVTQWYGKGIDEFPLDMYYLPHGFSKRLHKPKEEKIEFDTVFVGRNHPRRNSSDYVLKLRNVEYYGFGWPVKEEKIISPENISSLYNKALVCPNFHGDFQKADFNMINERTFQILASGAFQVCDYIPGIEKLFKQDELITCKTPKEWQEIIIKSIHNPDERKIFIENGLKAVQKYSYDNIMQDFVEEIKKVL